MGHFPTSGEENLKTNKFSFLWPWLSEMLVVCVCGRGGGGEGGGRCIHSSEIKNFMA